MLWRDWLALPGFIPSPSQEHRVGARVLGRERGEGQVAAGKQSRASSVSQAACWSTKGQGEPGTVQVATSSGAIE